MKNNIEMQAHVRSLLQRAEAFNMEEVLKRYVKDHRSTMAIARSLEHELKKFLVLCAASDVPNYGMKGPVDELWHTFIMFTRHYANFCSVVGGRFIHHNPTPTEISATDKRHRQDYRRFFEDYRQFYGEEPPAEYWPHPRVELKDDCAAGDPDCSPAECCHDVCDPSCDSTAVEPKTMS